MNRISYYITNVSALLLLISIYSCNSTSQPEWEQRNNELIEEYGLKVREFPNLPFEGVNPNLEVGTAQNLRDLDSIQLYPGVLAKMFWGNGNLVSVLDISPNTTVPSSTLTADRFLIIMDGTIRVNGEKNNLVLRAKEREEPDGTHSGTPRMDFIYQKKGSDSEIVVGDTVAKVMEIYSPIRLDYLEKMGITNLPSEMAEGSSNTQATILPDIRYDFFDIPLTQIGNGVFARLVSANNMQLSLVSADPYAESQAHIHREEQLTFLLRGNLTETVVDKKLDLEPNDIAFVPGNVIHANLAGDTGFDALYIFYPVREDYSKRHQAALEKYNKIIPENTTPELVIDGSKSEPNLTFSEGPKWMNGKLYFSNMYFDQNWNADPNKSSIVAMEADGTYKNIMEGKMQANGLYPYKNGNLVVCDMIGHRVVEMTTSGNVVEVIADSFDGKPIDGPNDIITDSKGGIYFTDPQFTMEAEKFQPGRAVYYVSPDKKITRLVEPNEFAMPNGILLSPNGKTLFINNCYDDESWYPVNSAKENFVWAYDVNDDGTISNGHKFAELRLPGNVLDRKGKSSSADGMAIDTEGNIYVATYLGVQIFDPKGSFIGIINLPSFPVSLGFGDEDMKTLYIVSYDKVFKIRTNQIGYVNYL